MLPLLALCAVVCLVTSEPLQCASGNFSASVSPTTSTPTITIPPVYFSSGVPVCFISNGNVGTNSGANFWSCGPTNAGTTSASPITRLWLAGNSNVTGTAELTWFVCGTGVNGGSVTTASYQFNGVTLGPTTATANHVQAITPISTGGNVGCFVSAFYVASNDINAWGCFVYNGATGKTTSPYNTVGWYTWLNSAASVTTNFSVTVVYEQPLTLTPT